MDEWNFMCHFYLGIVKVDDFRNNGPKIGTKSPFSFFSFFLSKRTFGPNFGIVKFIWRFFKFSLFFLKER